MASNTFDINLVYLKKYILLKQYLANVNIDIILSYNAGWQSNCPHTQTDLIALGIVQNGYTCKVEPYINYVNNF